MKIAIRFFSYKLFYEVKLLKSMNKCLDHFSVKDVIKYRLRHSL